jgi:hypothetical protein
VTFFDELAVAWCPASEGKEFIKQHHYSKGCHNGPMAVGLYRRGRLIGVCAFATPSSENVRASLWGVEHKNAVTELHRLVILDETPTNTESWFIVRALRLLKERKPHILGVLSFADPTEGHRGTIYRATNAFYCGTTGSGARFWRDTDGRLRHPRQNGVNVSAEDAAAKGWVAEKRKPKLRYLFLLPNGRIHRHQLLKTLRLDILPYPSDKPAVSYAACCECGNDDPAEGQVMCSDCLEMAA